MGLFKFQNYSAIKNAQDNPRVQATEEMVNGNIFDLQDNVNVGGVDYKEAAVVFADEAAAQDSDVWVMMNIVDKPEVRNYADYSVAVGEYVRAFNVNKLDGEMVEMSDDLVIQGGAAPAVGVALVPTNATDDDANPMVWKTIDDTTGYRCYLEITAVTTFGLFTIDNAGAGYEAKIKINW